MRHRRKALLVALALMASVAAMPPRPAAADSAADIDRQVDSALSNLDANTPAAVELSKKAVAILVFPSVVKAGFIFGGEYGTGGLRQNGQPAGYYSLAAASYGLQIGVQSFGYALFLMN